MEGDNVIVKKSKAFAIRIIRLYQLLIKEQHEDILSKQLLRSGTSIGANVTEAVVSMSRKDFLSKMYISYKEANETKYWLELLKDTGYLTEKSFLSISGDCDELIRILGSITKSVRESLRKG